MVYRLKQIGDGVGAAGKPSIAAEIADESLFRRRHGGNLSQIRTKS